MIGPTPHPARVVRIIGLAAVVAGCQAFLPSAADQVTIRNDTTTVVSIHVNGGVVGRIEAGSVEDIPLGGLGGPPFRIEARSQGGNVLFDWTISVRDVRQVRDGSASMSTGAAPGCGWIEARYGEPDPAAPIAAAPVGRAAPGGVCP